MMSCEAHSISKDSSSTMLRQPHSFAKGSKAISGTSSDEFADEDNKRTFFRVDFDDALRADEEALRVQHYLNVIRHHMDAKDKRTLNAEAKLRLQTALTGLKEFLAKKKAGTKHNRASKSAEQPGFNPSGW